jgi:hypothetical protein
MPEIEYLGPPNRAQLESWAEEIATQKGIPFHIFKGLIDHESSWDIHARNPKSSATGLGQFLDKDAKGIGMKIGHGSDDDRYNPRLSLEKAADYLVEKYNDSGKDWRRAVKSYGEGTESYMSKVTKNITKFFTPSETQAAEPGGTTGPQKIGKHTIEFLGPAQPQGQPPIAPKVEFVGQPQPTPPTGAGTVQKQPGAVDYPVVAKPPAGTGQIGSVVSAPVVPTPDSAFKPGGMPIAPENTLPTYAPPEALTQEGSAPGVAVAPGPTSPDQRTTGQQIAGAVAPYARGPLEFGGLGVGAAIGGAGGIPTGGIVSPVGAVVGGGLGYGIGKKAADALEAYAGQKPVPSLQKSMVQSAKDVVTGAAMEMGGAAGGKVLQKGLGVAGELGQKILGRISGVGPGTVEEALKGSANFKKALRGKISGEEVVDAVSGAMQQLRDARSATYQAQLADIAKINQEIDLTPLNGKVRDLMKQYNIRVNPDGVLDTTRIAMGKKGRQDIEGVIDTVWDWGSKPGDKTPLGLDALKRQLDDFYSESSQARAFVANLRNSVKDLITKNVPEYAKMTENYAEASQTIKDLESGLMQRKQGMTGRLVADQKLRRLTSAMRENFELRREMVNVLGAKTGEDLSGLIAGYAMNATLPQHLAGTPLVLIGEVICARFFNPAMWPVLAVSSPKAQGEFLRVFGKALKETKGLSLPVADVMSYLALSREEAENLPKENETYQFLSKTRPRGNQE